ncbi:hypothetical protein MN032_10885 [Agromyces atrinae]|uniref:hypothetical protein n=1 Tax=Agromyces atrinae TaxID=592376 RepID=UPI001F5A0EA5|nr:hypothetical protein [Agromyces atrinae]MCI2958202.1 hypothetical protein [Agromyces atrinae]
MMRSPQYPVGDDTILPSELEFATWLGSRSKQAVYLERFTPTLQALEERVYDDVTERHRRFIAASQTAAAWRP